MDDNQNVQLAEEPEPHFAVELIPAKASVFRLPYVGGEASSSGGGNTAPVLLKGERREEG